MEIAAQRRLTAQDYLAQERVAGTKHEFLEGEVFAMSGGTHNHSLIAGNLIAQLHPQLKGRSCRVLTSDMRLKVEATGLFAYPDLQIACGASRFTDSNNDTLLNPTVIFEVLSDSTAAWDRGKKFWHYRHLESLLDYVLVSQDAWLVEHYHRQPNGGWLLETVDSADGALRLASVGCEVPLSEVFAGTEIKPAAT